MRLRFAVPTLAGVLLGWASFAQADTPPAAPIFYCPAPAAAAPAKPGSCATTHVDRHHARRDRPIARVAVKHHRRHGPAAATTTVASNDVSASQAFIYRYERALHGLDARAADQAWAEGRHPPCPHGPADHCPDHWRHDGAPDIHVYAQSAPVPPVEERPLPPPLERAPPAPVPLPVPAPRRAYAWPDDHSVYRFDERDEESERAGGWRYSEVDGRGHYRHWGDHFDGEPGWGDRDGGRLDDGHGERDWAAPRYRCPPPVPASSCAAGPDAPVRHADVNVAGRDAAGYLTWPGKTE